VIFFETNLRNVGSGSNFTVDAVLQSASASNQHQRSASSSSGTHVKLGQAGPSQAINHNNMARHLKNKTISGSLSRNIARSFVRQLLTK